MKNEWILLDEAIPHLVRREQLDLDYGDYKDPRYDYRSDPVLVLFEDAYICTGIYEVYDTDDLTDERYFIIPSDEQDRHGKALAWMPIRNALPEWFIDEGWGSK